MPSAAMGTFHHTEFDARALVEAKGDHRVAVCLPARDEASTVGAIVTDLRRLLVDDVPLVDEIVVVDDVSTDGTGAVAADAGARVIRTDEVLADHHPGGGKGQALWKSLHVTDADIVAWCDADIRNWGPRFVVGLVGPLLTHAHIDFVKGFYERPFDGRPGEGGRVTELLARPVLSLLFPHLAPVVQPLAGEYAGRRSLLERLTFTEGYGVDLGLLIDAAEAVGLARMAQVDLGTRVHRNRPLTQLAPQAAAVLHAALRRTDVAIDDTSEALLASPAGEAIRVGVSELPALVDVPEYLARSA